MAKKIDGLLLLQIALGVFLVTLGVADLIDYDSGINQLGRFFGNNQILNLVIGIIEIAAGAFLIISIFPGLINGKVINLLGMIICVLWLIKLVYFDIVQGFNSNAVFRSLQDISLQSIVLIALWNVVKQK